MSTKSFTVTFERVSTDISYDGMALVKNVAAVDSGVKVAITDIRVLIPSGFNSDATNLAGTQGILSIGRVSSVSGGTAVSPILFDTGASGLPAQVSFKTFPASWTAGDTLRRFGDAWACSILLANNFASFRAPGIVDSNDHSGRTSEGHDVWHADGVSDTEPIVLREGEGIGAFKRAWGVPQTHRWNIIIKVASTSATYRYNIDTGSPYCLDTCLWSLVNGSGSGIVLYVYIVSMPDIGESNQPKYRICRANGLADSLGTAVTPVPHDTANTISEVVAYAGPFRPILDVDGLTQNYWNYQGVPVPIIEQQRVGIFRNFMVGHIIQETAPPNYRPYMPEEIWPGERRMAGTLTSDQIWLDVGEGLSIIGGLGGAIEASEEAYLNVEIVGYVTTPDAPVGGSTYSRGRVVNA